MSGPEPPPSLAPGAGRAPAVYHERQRLELCAVHALNNLLQGARFTRAQLDRLGHSLSPDSLVNPHFSLLGTGNYDVNVLMAALLSEGYAVIWWDKRRSLSSLALSQIYGFILNLPSNVCLGFLSLPIKRKHWVTVRQIEGTYYNLDSKLKTPAEIGDDEELRRFLREQISAGPCEVLLVVERQVEEDGSWCAPV